MVVVSLNPRFFFLFDHHTTGLRPFTLSQSRTRARARIYVTKPFCFHTIWSLRLNNPQWSRKRTGTNWVGSSMDPLTRWLHLCSTISTNSPWLTLIGKPANKTNVPCKYSDSSSSPPKFSISVCETSDCFFGCHQLRSVFP